MRKTVIFSLVMAASVALTAHAQGGISAEMLQKIQKQGPSSLADKALANAIASNSIDDLAKNSRASIAFDDHFSVSTSEQTIHNQKSSGRCWMFSGLNVLRSKIGRASCRERV